MDQIICRTCLDPTLVFVFGSNESGYHGAGAAHHALEKHGAVMGVSSGHTGRPFGSYAIPTKAPNVSSALKLSDIEAYVRAFIRYARYHDELQFDVTRIGCGLARYRDADIAPMFAAAPTNCLLPAEWSAILRSGHTPLDF